MVVRGKIGVDNSSFFHPVDTLECERLKTAGAPIGSDYDKWSSLALY
jgi:hypothetical protein